MTSSPPTGVKARAQRYLDAQPKDDGRTFHADHPEVIIAELIAEGSTLERELEEARARAPVFDGVAKRKLDDLISAKRGWKICGYAIEKDEQYGLVTTGAFVGWWSVADDNATASQAEVERLKAALSQHERLLLLSAVRKVAGEVAPLWLEAADHAAESVRAQVEERKP